MDAVKSYFPNISRLYLGYQWEADQNCQTDGSLEEFWAHCKAQNCSLKTDNTDDSCSMRLEDNGSLGLEGPEDSSWRKWLEGRALMRGRRVMMTGIKDKGRAWVSEGSLSCVSSFSFHRTQLPLWLPGLELLPINKPRPPWIRYKQLILFYPGKKLLPLERRSHLKQSRRWWLNWQTLRTVPDMGHLWLLDPYSFPDCSFSHSNLDLLLFL